MNNEIQYITYEETLMVYRKMIDAIFRQADLHPLSRSQHTGRGPTCLGGSTGGTVALHRFTAAYSMDRPSFPDGHDLHLAAQEFPELTLTPHDGHEIDVDESLSTADAHKRADAQRVCYLIRMQLCHSSLLLRQFRPFGVSHARIIIKEVVVCFQRHDFRIVGQHGIYAQLVPIKLREGLLCPSRQGTERQKEVYDCESSHFTLNSNSFWSSSHPQRWSFS